MRNNTLTKALTAAAAATLLVSGCSAGNGEDHAGNMSSSSSSATFNDADVTYAQGMSMHHQQAIEMSDIVLDKTGVNPQVTALAKKIKKAQKPEIKEMHSWLEDWGQGTDGHGSGMDGMGMDGMGMDGMGMDGMGMDGMVSAEDITKLKKADGKSASKLFLDQMIEHHEGAVQMAKDHRTEGKDPKALKLSTQVISDQKAEITEMKDMRSAL